MEMSTTLYQAALVGHITGITIMAGTAFIDFITFRAFIGAVHDNQAKGLILEGFLNKIQKFIGVGMLLIIVSGVMMMVKMHEVWGAQTWFRIKMVILLLVIINGFALRRRLGAQLRASIAEYSLKIASVGYINRLTVKITAIQVIQMLLFITIYILSVFKFN